MALSGLQAAGIAARKALPFGVVCCCCHNCLTTPSGYDEHYSERLVVFALAFSDMHIRPYMSLMLRTSDTPSFDKTTALLTGVALLRWR
eukprot:3508416-Amphidinium_carterae.1